MKVQMKVILLAVVLLGAFLFSAPAQAQGGPQKGDIGLGLGMATEVAGISAKTRLGDGMAVQGVLGTFRGWGRHWGFGSSGFGVAADFLMIQPALVSSEVLSLGWNYGAGAGLAAGSSVTRFGVTGVLGLEFNFVPAPIDFVIEYRPGVHVGSYSYYSNSSSNVHFTFIDFTGHIRFWF